MQEVIVVPLETRANRIICIPIDKSETAQKAVDWVLGTIYKEGDALQLLHVRHEAQQSLMLSPTFGYQDILDQMNQSFLNESKDLLFNVANRLKELHVMVEAISISGDPRHALIKEITEKKPAMVAMGQRGTGPASRAIMGSVSDYIVKHSPVSVIVIR